MSLYVPVCDSFPKIQEKNIDALEKELAKLDRRDKSLAMVSYQERTKVLEKLPDAKATLAALLPQVSAVYLTMLRTWRMVWPRSRGTVHHV